MSLAQRYKRYFDPKVRTRGEDYFRSGVVTKFSPRPTSLTARVDGTERYRVSMRYEDEDGALWASCDCPFFQDNIEPCKHLYAVMLLADERGALGSVPGDAELRLEVDPDADALDDEVIDVHTPSDVLRIVPGLLAGAGQDRATRKTDWKRQLDTIADAMRTRGGSGDESWPAGRELVYAIDAPGTAYPGSSGLVVEVMSRDRRADGQWGEVKHRKVPRQMVERLPDAADRRAISLMTGYESWGYSLERFTLPVDVQAMMVRLLCETGRCVLIADDDGRPTPLTWDDGPAWELRLAASHDAGGKHLDVTASFHRGDEKMALEKPVLMTEGGLVFTRTHAARLDDGGAFPWVAALRQHGKLRVPAGKSDELLTALLNMPRLPHIEMPQGLAFERVRGVPKPCLRIRSPKGSEYTDGKLIGELSFDYDGTVVASRQPGAGVFDGERRRFTERDPQAEGAAEARMRSLGFREPPRYQHASGELLLLSPKKLGATVRDLTAAGWRIEADGKLYRTGGGFQLEVRSGIDWFELHGKADFDGASASMPELLKALRRGENTVLLDDGTFGVLPEEWLARYGMFAAVGESHDDHLRFRPTQVMLLDLLLASQDQVSCDEVFQKAREKLKAFDGVSPVDPPPTFHGTLRPYQRIGLGWLQFLREFSFGGCLADDMGLGKTVQVLAMLEERRLARAETPGGAPIPPSLVVAPRSLIYNWMDEAARFTPGLRVLDHSHPTRDKTVERFADHDLILTTYGTLRRDAELFAGFRFDYAILDESQAVKNQSTASSKAVRVLKADHRLALSGTPIENHLGELWSLFEFLNPGMLGSASAFKGVSGANGTTAESRRLLAGALRPFILRRTKGQVAQDLPRKTEQTIFCELPAAQRKLYDDLREHYRSSLLGRIAREGLAKSKIHVLEALLRLRQAACHPGLIDKSRTGDDSAKLSALIPQLTEVAEEGHKALVFSQFTSLLAIVRQRLDAAGITYEYLDGKTRDRAARVKRFQGDESCKLFLISLKAGGLGLNLTAADYVFLLDPWWNPAVEAQAVDRAHRIGQTRHVFAYRLIAQGTVEEKVLELQKSKRDLADAIINADNSLIRDLKREDLEMLLS